MLFSVIIHIGDKVQTGHYRAYTRKNEDNWYLCDDHHVQEIPENTLKNDLAKKDPQNTPYILLYHRVNVRKYLYLCI